MLQSGGGLRLNLFGYSRLLGVIQNGSAVEEVSRKPDPWPLPGQHDGRVPPNGRGNFDRGRKILRRKFGVYGWRS